MATPVVQSNSKMQQKIKADRRMFAASDDTVMMKQIQATHAPDGREIDVRPILHVIEDILSRAHPGDIHGVINGTADHQETMEDRAALSGFDGILDALTYVIQKISCELSCKCSGGGDAHSTTMTILGLLGSYPWDAKLVISLAAFAVNYGEFWLVAQLFTTNPLAKSVALLKQLPDIIEDSASLKPRFDSITNLLKAMEDVTKCIVEFKDLPPQYISDDQPPLSIAMAHIPTAVYWTIRSMVACANQVTSLLGMSHEHIVATTEAWELSSLAHKVRNIHDHLQTQLSLCYHHIDEKKHVEYYHMLIRLFETPHMDNLRILKALIHPRDDLLKFMDNKQITINIESLRRKTVLLLISDLDLSLDELGVLAQFYDVSRGPTSDTQYEVVWLPIVDKSTGWTQIEQEKLEMLQSQMPWPFVHHPTQLEPAVIRYIKEVWHFTKKMTLVALDPQGKVASPNALHMVWIWGNLAYPFTSAREETLWKEEIWRLELLTDGIDPYILEERENKYVCLYGGEDIEWIRRFTHEAKAVAAAAGINLDMVYVGKSNAKERVRKITTTITTEELSRAWTNLSLIWFFWARLESMLYSKTQHGKRDENDRITQEVLTMLSFDGSDLGWAVICRGSSEMARANGDTILKSLTEYAEWQEEAAQRGFVPALIDHLHKLHSPQHCNRLILPAISGGIPERVVCAECGRPMEKYFMFRCCTD